MIDSVTLKESGRIIVRCLLAAALLLVSAVSHADATLRVVSESGDGLSGLEVRVNGVRVTTDAAGQFAVRGDNDNLLRIDVSAADHYAFTHTIDPRDLSLGAIRTIELVRNKPGRRLLLFAGDAMMTRRYLEPRANEPVLVRKDSVAEDAARLLEPIRPYIELADFASVNLETTLAEQPPGIPIPKSVRFYSHPVLASALEDAGFDYVALGNNHTNDFREGGVESTIAALEKTSLAWSGVGMSEDESRVPALANILEQPYAFLSYVGWLGFFEPSQAAVGDNSGATFGNPAVFAEDLETTGPGFTSVLQYHSGLEYGEMPAMSVRTELRHAVDKGADVAIGHHPHVLQGYELYRDKLIAYSIGNFLFDQFYYTTQLGALTYVWMDEDRFHRAEIVPLHINGYIPTPATGSMRFATLHRIARLSAPFGTCFGESGAHAVLRRGFKCSGEEVRFEKDADAPVSLRQLGLSPVSAVSVVQSPGQYRLGTDILRRGEFDYVGLFGTSDRGWLTDANVSVGESLKIRLLPGARSVRTGMKMFHRTYKPSTPTTLAGRIRIDGDARVRVLLQRQRRDRGLGDELRDGPLIELGVIERGTDEWTRFSMAFNQPRVATQAVRLLFDVVGPSELLSGATVELDDLSWVEWATPWLNGPQDEPRYATHVELR